MSQPQQPWQNQSPPGAVPPPGYGAVPGQPVGPPQPPYPGQPPGYPQQYPVAPGQYPAGAGYPPNVARPGMPVPPGQPQYPPGYGAPGYGQPPAPAYGQPAYGAGPYGQPVPPGQPPQYPQYPQPPQPVYQQPGQPVAYAPGYPGQVAPGYGAPTQPGYAQPGYPQPVAPRPVAAPMPQPVPVRPVVQPTPVQPVQVQPVPVRPVSVQPVANAAPVSVAPAATPKPVSVAPSVQPVKAKGAAAPATAKGAAPLPTQAAGVAAAARPIPVSAAARPIPVSAKNQSLIRAAEKDPEEESADVEQKIVRNAPPWLVSMIVHVIAIFVMAFWYFATKEPKNVQLSVFYAEDIGVQLEDDKLTTGLMEELDVKEPSISMDSVAVDDPLAAPPQLEVSLDGTTATDSIQAPSIGLALTGREKGMKQALLGKYGGTATTEAAVRLGLEWLKRNQSNDGSWSLTGKYGQGSTIENRCAATSMALIAFQGAGHTHKDGDFKKEVAKGWKALLAMQDRDGLFYHEGLPHQQLYAQAQATIAICELYGMTKDQEYKKPAQLAVDYAVKTQAPEGGWRYTPGVDSDTSVTGWFVIGLQSAMMAGLEVPSPTLEKITKFLDSVQSENGTRYAYRPGNGSTETMTAEALLCRQYLNWKHNDPRLADGVKFLLNNPIRWDFENTNVYYWYYATQVTHHMEGEIWKEWNNTMREVIPKKQEKTGAEAGSWTPSEDRWGSHGGRLYQTCLCIYMLEVYYRHLPIYKWKQQ